MPSVDENVNIAIMTQDADMNLDENSNIRKVRYT